MTPAGYVVRPAEAADLGALAAIELAANTLFPPGVLPPSVQGRALPPELLQALERDAAHGFRQRVAMTLDLWRTQCVRRN